MVQDYPLWFEVFRFLALSVGCFFTLMGLIFPFMFFGGNYDFDGKHPLIKFRDLLITLVPIMGLSFPMWADMCVESIGQRFFETVTVTREISFGELKKFPTKELKFMKKTNIMWLRNLDGEITLPEYISFNIKVEDGRFYEFKILPRDYTKNMFDSFIKGFQFQGFDTLYKAPHASKFREQEGEIIHIKNLIKKYQYISFDDEDAEKIFKSF